MTQSNPISLLMFGCGGFARRYHVQPVLDAADVRIEDQSVHQLENMPARK